MNYCVYKFIQLNFLLWLGYRIFSLYWIWYTRILSKAPLGPHGDQLDKVCALRWWNPSVAAISPVVVAYRDRLNRYGFELIKTVCRHHGAKVVVHNVTEGDTDGGEEDGLIHDPVHN